MNNLSAYLSQSSSVICLQRPSEEVNGLMDLAVEKFLQMTEDE